MSANRIVPINHPSFRPDAVQARYWEGPLSRAEAQKVYDEFTVAIRALQAQVGALDLAMAFVMNRIGATQEDFQKFMQAKLAEHQAAEAAQADAPENTPAETTPAVTLE